MACVLVLTGASLAWWGCSAAGGDADAEEGAVHGDASDSRTAEGDARPEEGTVDVPVPPPPQDEWLPVSSSDDTTYTSEYLNAVVAAEAGGKPALALVAGRHGKYFPYFEKKESWDSLLLSAGTSTLQVEEEAAAGFHLWFDAEAGKARIYYHGTMAGSDGTAVTALVDLHLDARFEPEQLFGVTGGEGEDFLGMSHRHAFLALSSTAASTLRVGDGPVIELSSLAGEMELGKMHYMQDPGAAFRWDYLCAASATGGFAYLRFAGHALNPDAPGGDMIENLIGKGMQVEVTLDATGTQEGNPKGLAGDLLLSGGGLLAEQTVDLGLAEITRQLLVAADANGNDVYGLREIIKAKE